MIINKINVKYKIKLVQLKLGNHYIVWYDYKKKMVCKFIQPTKCGFNLLNLNTNKCILRHHLYPSKYKQYNTGDWFFVNENLKIENVNYEIIKINI